MFVLYNKLIYIYYLPNTHILGFTSILLIDDIIKNGGVGPCGPSYSLLIYSLLCLRAFLISNHLRLNFWASFDIVFLISLTSSGVKLSPLARIGIILTYFYNFFIIDISSFFILGPDKKYKQTCIFKSSKLSSSTWL